MKKLHALCFLALLLSPLTYAETVVLIHGYLSNSSDWGKSHVTEPLQRAGWHYGGNYTNTRTLEFGVMTPATRDLTAKGKRFYTVDLPIDASISIQSRVLGYYLQHLYSQRKEPITLVGHSAGGIVARAWLTTPQVKSHPIDIKALITIASPHLGTPLASWASLGIKTPLNEVSRFLGIKNFRRSSAVFEDLKKEKQGNYLYRLNRLNHPSIQYISVIRSSKTGLNKFDYVVPKKSQDMNNIFAIHGQSATLLTQGNHYLSAKDGTYIRDLLTLIYQPNTR